MITERTLNNWRAQALHTIEELDKIMPVDLQPLNERHGELRELCERNLRLTQELLDQHLLRKNKIRETLKAQRRFANATK